MTAESKDPREQLNKIAQLFIEDLFNTSDTELLQEASKDESLGKARDTAKNAYLNAIQSTGAKRLQIARAEMTQQDIKTKANMGNIDATRAHKIIAKLSAANDASFTLAARNLKNISDAEAIELVNELTELGAIQKDDEF